MSVDPNERGRKVWVPGDVPGAIYILTGALLALWRLGWMPDGADPPPAAWTRSSLSEVQSLAMRLAEAENPDARLWPHQAEACVAALSAPAGQSIIDLGTSGGKTRLSAALCTVGSVDTGPGAPWLYLIGNKELCAQTLEDFERTTGPMAETLGIAAPRILACSYSQIKHLEDNYFAGVIVDETHQLSPRTRSGPYAHVPAGYRIGLSGTAVDRLDADNALTIGLTGPIVYSMQVGELQHRGHVAPGRVQRIVYDADRDEIL
jgi:superfamily II DNA or RNA helicase